MLAKKPKKVAFKHNNSGLYMLLGHIKMLFCYIIITNMRIYISGYMYSGKSTVGRRLARRLGYEFLDTDAMFENRFRISIHDFLHRYDEPLFRRLEHDILLSTAEKDNCVVSTGGGTPCYSDNMDFMCAQGITVYLEASTDLIMSRHAKSKKVRPLLEGMSRYELEAFVKKQLEARRPYYERAMLRFGAEDISIDAICEALKKATTDISSIPQVCQ